MFHGWIIAKISIKARRERGRIKFIARGKVEKKEEKPPRSCFTLSCSTL